MHQREKLMDERREKGRNVSKRNKDSKRMGCLGKHGRSRLKIEILAGKYTRFEVFNRNISRCIVMFMEQRRMFQILKEFRVYIVIGLY